MHGFTMIYNVRTGLGTFAFRFRTRNRRVGHHVQLAHGLGQGHPMQQHAGSPAHFEKDFGHMSGDEALGVTIQTVDRYVRNL